MSNILCKGERKSGKTNVYQALISTMRKNPFEYYRVIPDIKKCDDEKLEHSLTDYKKSLINNVGNKIQDEFFFNDNYKTKSRWFESELEYEYMWPDIVIYLINDDSSIYKWYMNNLKYHFKEDGDKIQFYLWCMEEYKKDRKKCIKQVKKPDSQLKLFNNKLENIPIPFYILDGRQAFVINSANKKISTAFELYLFLNDNICFYSNDIYKKIEILIKKYQQCTYNITTDHNECKKDILRLKQRILRI